jgi:hypothetical protein
MIIKRMKPETRAKYLPLIFGVGQIALGAGLLIERFAGETLAFYAGMLLGFGTVMNLFFLALAGREIRRRREEKGGRS